MQEAELIDPLPVDRTQYEVERAYRTSIDTIACGGYYTLRLALPSQQQRPERYAMDFSIYTLATPELIDTSKHYQLRYRVRLLAGRLATKVRFFDTDNFVVDRQKPQATTPDLSPRGYLLTSGEPPDWLHAWDDELAAAGLVLPDTLAGISLADDTLATAAR